MLATMPKPCLPGHTRPSMIDSSRTNRRCVRADRGAHWWELRSCDYYDLFGRPKVLWKDLSFYSEFAFDSEGTYTNNLCYFIPTDDLWLVAVLNSPLVWSYLWRNATHGKDEVLRLQTIFMETLPIARPAPELRAATERSVRELIKIARERSEATVALLEWLRIEWGIDKPGVKLSAPESLALDDFIGEVKSRRPGRGSVTSGELRRLRDEYESTVPALQGLLRRAGEVERVVAAAVHAAYGLTEEEVSLLWRTAPPRMPQGRVDVALH